MDSASSTELYALLSRLSEVPLRQDLAVTGSVNQWGEVQVIGGVNEKIEGFFDVCKAHRLTGQQGVLIPATNVRNLVLRADVLDAIEHGQFHIYPVRTIDEGIELLSGIRAGTVDEPDTINGRVSRRLHELAISIKKFGSQKKEYVNGEEKNRRGRKQMRSLPISQRNEAWLVHEISSAPSSSGLPHGSVFPNCLP